jgi:hypothetical protein
LKHLVKQKAGITVYGDSSCVLEKPPRFHDISQKIIDDIYERNYNAILFKNVKSALNFEYKILATEDSEEFTKIFNNFFKP